MNRGVNRPVKAYLFQTFWIGMGCYWWTKSLENWAEWMSGILIGISVISFGYIIVKRWYFEVRGTDLLLNENIFVTRKIPLNKIEKVEIEPGPFTSSKLILKDNTFIKYSDIQTSDKKLAEFMRQFNIPVE